MPVVASSFLGCLMFWASELLKTNYFLKCILSWELRNRRPKNCFCSWLQLLRVVHSCKHSELTLCCVVYFEQLPEAILFRGSLHCHASVRCIHHTLETGLLFLSSCFPRFQADAVCRAQAYFIRLAHEPSSPHGTSAISEKWHSCFLPASACLEWAAEVSSVGPGEGHGNELFKLPPLEQELLSVTRHTGEPRPPPPAIPGPLWRQLVSQWHCLGAHLSQNLEQSVH